LTGRQGVKQDEQATLLMEHIIAFSGGLNSFEVARLLCIEQPVSSVTCIFTDTKTEDSDLYRFMNQAINYLGCQFIHLKDGRNIWQVFKDERFMGNSRVDPCSRILKRQQFAKWLKNKNPEDVILYYGIAADEKHRMIQLVERWKPFQVQAPLIELQTTKEQILLTLDKIGIEPPALYELGFEHNNCGGFCVKSGQRQMRKLLEIMPERYAWHEAEQEALFAGIGNHGFIRSTTNGNIRYLSLKEFREEVESKQPIQLFEDGGCACFC
jgi:hypothetical protein